MFQTYLQEKKEVLLSSLHNFLKLQKQHATNRWGKDAIERLELFMQNGKMMRGTLVFLGFEIIEEYPTNDVLLTAQAIEFFQAGLLIHDDIMDSDELRRGKPSIHTQYTKLIEQENGRDPIHTGQSLGVCVGDAAFFLGFQLLNQTRNQRILDLFSQELTNVSFAQMQDVHNGTTLKNVQLEDILSLYRHKTGHYSIALPMIAGAMLAGANNDTLQHVDKFGTAIGIAYQLLDDKLNLFGDPDKTGKPVGSDIRERKQTPYLFYLKQKGVDVTKMDIPDIKNTIIDLGIDKDLTDLIISHTTSAKEALQKIPITKTRKELILSFVDYLIHRVK